MKFISYVFMLFVLLILSEKSFAQFMAKSEMFGNCDAPRRVFRLKKKCELSKKQKCFRWKKSYRCETHEVKEVEIDDVEKPDKKLKSEVEACDDKEDCEQKLPNKVCSTNLGGFYRQKADNSFELYCLQQTYKKKNVEVVSENATKKASYLSAVKAKKDKEKADKNSRKAILTKLEGDQDLSKAELRKVLKFVLKRLK